MLLGKKKTKKNEVPLKKNVFVPQKKTDNMIIERCKHHKIRKEEYNRFHYEHCKKHKSRCKGENCWPKKQKKKNYHKKYHRKRNIFSNKQNYSDEKNYLYYNEKLNNKNFKANENTSTSNISSSSNTTIHIEDKITKDCNKDAAVKCEKKLGKNSSKIAAFLPEKQLWQWSGDHFKRLGVKGRSKKKFYKSIQRGNETLSIGECAIFLSTGTDRPYVGKIQTMWETSSNSKVVRVRWFYHPEETMGCPKLTYSGGLFESSHEDENDVQTISHKCEVISLNDYINRFGADTKKCSIYYNIDTYYYVGFYDPVTHRINMESTISTSEEHQ